MGRMKEIFMREVQEKYGSYENYTQQLNETAAKQWVHKETPCPNCMNATLLQNQHLNIVCDSCGQEFIEVEGSLRFK
jgi:hypothetical protein